MKVNRSTMIGLAAWICLALVALPAILPAQPFSLPTANRYFLEPSDPEKAFTGTVGRPWMSGIFGCVRTSGWKFHEGLDISALEHDSQNESTDPVLSIADGIVLYVSDVAGNSSYGKYVVLGHHVEGMDICSLYAHLREVQPGIKVATRITRGQRIGTLGRTANTRQGISKDRAHLHLEIALFLNRHFPEWYQKRIPGARNDHGMWNGQNLAGIDPWEIYTQQQEQGPAFSLLNLIQSQPLQCRVLVKGTQIPFAKRYAPLVESRPHLDPEAIAGYEIHFSHWATPMKLIPKSADELNIKGDYQVVEVNESVYTDYKCRRLVTKRTGVWDLNSRGRDLVGLLTHVE